MRASTSPARLLILPVLGFALNVAVSSTGFAQVGSFGSGTIQPPPRDVSPAPAPPGRAAAEGALPLGSWLVYPSMFAGVVYDTNIDQVNTGARSAVGLRFTPSISGVRDDGVNQTTLYGMVDGRLYSKSGNNADVVSAKIGVTDRYQPVSDWIFNVTGDFTRQSNLFSTFGVDKSLTNFNTTGNGLSPSTNPTPYNQMSGNVSAQKNMDKAFAILSASVVNQVFDNQAGAISPNSVTTSANLRGGYWITPVIYGFVEGGGDNRAFSNRTLSSNGYRVTTGLGIDQAGFIRGEIYGGFQQQDFRNAANLGEKGNGLVGFRMEYFPRPELTFRASVDQSIGATQLATPTSTQVTSVLGSVDYSISRQWSTTARAGYIHSDFIGGNRTDDAWTVGATLNYSIVRNIDATLDFQHLELGSNTAGQSFNRDVATIGVTYRY